MLLLGLTVGFASHAKDLPSKWNDFEKLSFKEMKALPDVKVDLNKKLSAEDLKGKSETELILMKNSIYAQHGFRFDQKAVANYFLGRKWYKPNMETQGLEKLNEVSRANLEMFLKEQVAVKGGGRETAAEHAYEMSQMAYNLFSMGFCTYEVGGDPKAGMIVFDPGGEAHVFHSSASRAAFAPYAYEHYLDKETKELGNASLLIPARWSLKKEGDVVHVDLNFDEDSIARYQDEKGRRIIASGTRRVLSSNVRGGDMYPFVKTKQCQMVRIAR
jgi:hypothetical protein